MYGTATNSPVHGTLGTDRFVVSWPVLGDPHPMPDDPVLLVGVPVAGGAPGDAPAADETLPDSPSVLVRIPGDYAALLEGDLARARAWRASARQAFQHYLHGGYRVWAFVPGQDGDAAYLLTSR